jgi:hypothetical protein
MLEQIRNALVHKRVLEHLEALEVEDVFEKEKSVSSSNSYPTKTEKVP